MSYLKHVIVDEIMGLGPYGEQVSGYTPRYEIVDFIYQGAPFDPSNLPNNDLEVVTKSTTTGSTVLGSQLTGTPATFTGGRAPVLGVSQWQRGTDGAWTGITQWAEPTQDKYYYTTVAADNGLNVRLASKATDADGKVVYGSGNSIGPMEPSAIVVTEPTTSTNGTFLNPTHAYMHETLSMNPAIMIGGYGTITYKYRLQEMEHGTDTWSNLTGWQSGIPTYTVSQSDEGDQLRFQTQGTDELGTTKVSNSPATTVAVSTEIGDVIATPPGPLSMDPGELVGFTATCSGDADPLYLWAIRSGPALITSTFNFGPTVEVTINADAGSGETVQVQVTADDPSSTDTPQSTVVTIVVN